MRAAVTAGLLTGFFVVAGAAPALAAGNPSGTGLPSQSCQDIEAAGGSVPGNSSSSPGSRIDREPPVRRVVALLPTVDQLDRVVRSRRLLLVAQP